MKILYAIQGTGNGHISRAKDIIPALQKRVETDILISGTQADINLPYVIKHRYKGMSFVFGKSGNVDLLKTFKSNNLRRFYKEIKSCPVQDYDLVINDFEPISARAAKWRGIPCFSLSHQSALHSPNVPRPKHKDRIGKFILNHYAPADKAYSFHFKKYDDRIFTPVIRKEIRNHTVALGDYITVYLPAYGDKKLIKVLRKIKNTRFEVFSKHTQNAYIAGNIKISRINGDHFSESMAGCAGVLCGAGFETPAEALFLGKKLLVIPMKNQYEQHFNAEGLKDLGIKVLPKLSKKYVPDIKAWIKSGQSIQVDFPDETQSIVDSLLQEFYALFPVKSVAERISLFPETELLNV
jgi:uncharacterized protein (TIGR00661 family)